MLHTTNGDDLLVTELNEIKDFQFYVMKVI